ncbi:SpoIIE family protein phosphatase [candidate division KSB1 bacterium]|nr:SpoIIE family protein phosphatase [candidate division KSB1 bacterium]
MKKPSKIEYIVWSILGATGLILFLIYQPQVVPLSKVKVSIGRAEAARTAVSYLETHGFDVTELDSLYRAVRFLPSPIQERPYQILNFSDEDYEFLEERSPAYYWQVSWYDNSGTQLYQAFVSPDGRAFGFDHFVPEDVPGDSLTREEAEEVMDDFLETKLHLNLDKYELLEVSSDKQKSRMDYFLTYYSKYDFPGEIQLQLRTTLRGDQVHRVVTFFSTPERFTNESVTELQNEGILRFVVVPVIMVAIFIILGVMYILRFHAGEIAVKAPIIVGMLYTIIIALMSFNTFDLWTTFGPGNASPAIRIAGYLVVFALMGVFGAVMILVSWSVGDSIVREKWGYKLTLFDRISSGRILFPSLLSSVFIGYMAGLVTVGLWSGLSYVATQNFSAWTESRSVAFLLTSYMPVLEVVGEALTDSLFYSFIGTLFLVAFFKKQLSRVIKNDSLNSFVAVLLMAALVSVSQSLIPLYPISWRFGITVISSFILGWVFVKYDLVAVLVAGFILSILPYAHELLLTEYFSTSGIISYVFALAPLGIGLFAYFKGTELTAEEIAAKPSYVKLITQRERMAQELDIARNVQMSLLPKQNPIVEGYDIAGVCLPALEVGGDYYDFFHLGDGKIGIAIGDVSGKGVPAAIYMTLTKGILQTCASDSNSPKQVLNKLNKQIYNNIERNSFVSMFYAVLDMKKRTLRFSRAGHNPAIVVHRSKESNTLLEPKGMAVGLEAGDKFNEILEENEIQVERGDVLTFYTDGFTEASTKDGDEFGEDQLFDVVSDSKDSTANAIIQKVVRAVKSFVGNHPQHDDMTMVVIKVN